MNLDRTILECIDRAPSDMMGEVELIADVRVFRASENVSRASFMAAVRGLEEAGEIVVVPQKDRIAIYKITAAGRARLAE